MGGRVDPAANLGTWETKPVLCPPPPRGPSVCTIGTGCTTRFKTHRKTKTFTCCWKETDFNEEELFNNLTVYLPYLDWKVTTLSSWNHLAGAVSVYLSFYHHLVIKTLASWHTSEIFGHLKNVHTLQRICWALKPTAAQNECLFILLLPLPSAMHTMRIIWTLKFYGHVLHGYDTNNPRLHYLWTKTKRSHYIHPPIIRLLKMTKTFKIQNTTDSFLTQVTQYRTSPSSVQEGGYHEEVFMSLFRTDSPLTHWGWGF
jgi:hypothetical protein